MLPGLPARSKVKMSPSHLAALLGVLGSELQLERRRVFLLGELGSSAVTSNSGHVSRVKEVDFSCLFSMTVGVFFGRYGKLFWRFYLCLRLTGGVASLPAVASQDGSWRGGQTLQGGRREDLLWVELWELSKTLFEVHLRAHTAVFPAHKRPQRWNTVIKIPRGRPPLNVMHISLVPSG